MGDHPWLSVTNRDPLTATTGVPISHRETWQLSDEEVCRALAAADRASELGLSFNRFVTILWERFGVTDVQAATRKFVKEMTAYLRRHGYDTLYLWVIENGPRIGLHAHILLHLPPEMASQVRYRQRAWLTAAGARYAARLIRSKPIGGRTDAYRSKGSVGQRFPMEQARTVAYTLKCCSFEMKNAMRSPFGVRSNLVFGKRMGIGRSGLKSVRDLEDRAE